MIDRDRKRHLLRRGSAAAAWLPLILLLGLSLPAAREESPRAESGPPAPRDWTVFRGGPRLDGFRDVRVSASPRLIWTFDTGSAVESSAAIAGGIAYAGTSDGDLLALDAGAGGPDGKLLWKYPAGAGIRSSPGVHGGRVYFGDDAGMVHAVDAKTGTKSWVYETEGGAEIISSPNFHGDLLLVGSYDGHLYCLEAKTGKERWKLLTEGPVHSTPAVASGKTFVSGCDQLLRVVDVESGKEDAQVPLGGVTAASPAVDGDRLYVGTRSNQVLAIDWKKPAVLWTYEKPEAHFPFQASCALAEELVVTGSHDKSVHAIDRRTGEARWTFKTKARVESSPVIAGERVIAGSNDRNLYLLDLASGGEVWRFETDGAFIASPALAGGRLVIGTDSGLIYCFDIEPGDPVETGLPK